MKEAIGGVLSLNLILIFLVIISCYLAFSVNYTKAFRVKNEIRSIIEKNEGLNCEALEQIEDLMDKSNYSVPPMFQKWCGDSGYVYVGQPYLAKGGFCYKMQLVDKYGTADGATKYKGAYYTVVTFTNIINMPTLGGQASGTNDLTNLLASTFMVKGETALIYSSGTKSTSGTSSCGFELQAGEKDKYDAGNYIPR